MGVGGTWNLNEEKNPDAEIVASGVFVGFFLYTAVLLLTYAFGTTREDKTLAVSKRAQYTFTHILKLNLLTISCSFKQNVIMNFIGTVLFIAVGGIALHYWIGYQPEHKYRVVSTEQRIGITVGIMCVISGAIYAVDTVLSFINFVKDISDED